MADVLLTHANHLYFDRKQVRKMQPYPPLQTLLAAAVLRQSGFEVALFDSTLNAPEEGFHAALAGHGPRLVVICEDNFNFLTKMCLTRNRELAFYMLRAAKEQGLPVLVNSSDASDHAADYLAAGADFVLIGEVEVTLRETVEKLLGPAAGNNRDSGGGSNPRRVQPGMESVRGLVYRDSGSGALRRTAPREPMRDLDEIPFPAWDLADIPQYRQAWLGAHGYFSLNIVASRGCPYRCNWCAKPIYGQTYHFRAPELVAREMQELKARFQPQQLWFADDIFALSPHWTQQFADAVDALGAQIPFKMQSRCDLMTRDTVAALRRAGCAEVWMGAESGSQSVLDAMDKGIRVAHISEARENLRRHRIRAGYFLQFGYPGEKWEDIQRTIRLVRQTQPDDIGVSVAYPLPGTEFHQRVSAQLGSKTNWADSDDLSMMFQGAYTSEFYRALRDALHLEVDVAHHRRNGTSADELQNLWRAVEELEKTSANPNPTFLPQSTVLWTCS